MREGCGRPRKRCPQRRCSPIPGSPSTASPTSWRSATARSWARISRSTAGPSTGSTATASPASWTRGEAWADMALLLGLDIGTTSTVGIVIDSEGGTLALASRPVELHTPQLNRVEEDPEEWWANVGAISRELLASAGIGPEAIAGIGVTGMLPAIVLLDR